MTYLDDYLVWSYTSQKMKFSIKDFFSISSDLVTFTEEILNGKLHFLPSVTVKNWKIGNDIQ